MSPNVRPALDAGTAAKVIAAAEAKAHEIGVPSTIAAVDESGVLKSLVRMDGSILASVGVAQDKAYTSAATGGPTGQWYDVAQADPSFGFGLNSIARFCPLAGGLPITVDGQVVGGIGASGGTPDQDLEIAAAGLAVLN
ncbi:heme-binding protein [Pseudonocardia sp. NPDC049635]|uniref:GlcG/HbpS family heme-binding protein n=1 Tax=Pseudonocardia sp. NPDC049635 TaxID=3155506 RepID=UPI0033C18A67